MADPALDTHPSHTRSVLFFRQHCNAFRYVSLEVKYKNLLMEVTIRSFPDNNQGLP